MRLFSLAVTVAVSANPDANGIGDSDISTNTAVKETKALNTDEHVAVGDMPMKFSENDEEPRARRRVNKIWQEAKEENAQTQNSSNNSGSGNKGDRSKKNMKNVKRKLKKHGADSIQSAFAASFVQDSTPDSTSALSVRSSNAAWGGWSGSSWNYPWNTGWGSWSGSSWNDPWSEWYPSTSSKSSKHSKTDGWGDDWWDDQWGGDDWHGWNDKDKWSSGGWSDPWKKGDDWVNDWNKGKDLGKNWGKGNGWGSWGKDDKWGGGGGNKWGWNDWWTYPPTLSPTLSPTFYPTFYPTVAPTFSVSSHCCEPTNHMMCLYASFDAHSNFLSSYLTANIIANMDTNMDTNSFTNYK